MSIILYRISNFTYAPLCEFNDLSLKEAANILKEFSLADLYSNNMYLMALKPTFKETLMSLNKIAGNGSINIGRALYTSQSLDVDRIYLLKVKKKRDSIHGGFEEYIDLDSLRNFFDSDNISRLFNLAHEYRINTATRMNQLMRQNSINPNPEILKHVKPDLSNNLCIEVDSYHASTPALDTVTGLYESYHKRKFNRDTWNPITFKPKP